MSKFIVIEGLDGSGKSTQLTLLKNHLEQQQIPYEYVHFPRMEQGVFGDLVARFLRGEFGDINQVNPYLVALIYAGDRKDAAELIQGWLKQGKLVVIDRYVHSNIAFQCAKLSSIEEVERLEQWIKHLEFSYYQIPAPDLSVFLHVPFEFVQKQLTSQRDGEDRSYLKGKEDIHENDLGFQKRVEEEYLRMIKHEDKYTLLTCCDEQGSMLPAATIHQQILDLLKSNHIL